MHTSNHEIPISEQGVTVHNIGYDTMYELAQHRPPDQHELAASPPRYIRTLASGLRYVNVGVTMQALLPVCFIIMSTAIHVTVNLTILASTTSDLLYTGLGTLASFIAAVGWWRVSERDPSLRDNDPSNAVRSAIRQLMVFGVVVALANAVFGLTGSLSQTQPSATTATMVRTGKFTAITVIAVQFFYAMRYLKMIALRTNDQALAREVMNTRKTIVLYFTVGWLIIIGPLLGLIAYARIISNVRQAVLREYKVAVDLESN